MNDEFEEMRAFIRDRIKDVFEDILGQKLNEATRVGIETRCRAGLREAALRWPPPVNSGLTVGEIRRTHPWEAPGVPDDWEMWCEGWDVNAKADKVKINVELVPIAPSYRPPVWNSFGTGNIRDSRIENPE